MNQINEAMRHKTALGAAIRKLENLRSKVPSEVSALTRENLADINKGLLDSIDLLSAEYRTL